MTCTSQNCSIQHTTQPSGVWPWRPTDQVTLPCNHSYHPACFTDAIHIQWNEIGNSQCLTARCANCNQIVENPAHLITPYLAPRVWNFPLRKPTIFLGMGLGLAFSFMGTLSAVALLLRGSMAALPIAFVGGCAGMFGGAVLTDKLLTFAILRIYHWANGTALTQPGEYNHRLLTVHQRRLFRWQKSSYRTNPV